jgi:signal peptidase I
MSPSRNGDSPGATDTRPEPVISGPPEAAVTDTRPERIITAQRGPGARLPQDFDYRLRGLSTDPRDYVPVAPARPERRRRPRRHAPLLAKTTVLVVVALLTAWLLQAFVVQPFAVPGKAMTPSLQAGDRILAGKSGLLAGAVHSGDIVVFRPPQFLPCNVAGTGSDLVLRVVALPGQTIWSIDNTIFVNGRPLQEKGWYDPRYGQVASRPIQSTTLAANQYYVLGDNRLAACDSRVFGPISKSSIVGTGIAVVVRHGHLYLHKL